MPTFIPVVREANLLSAVSRSVMRKSQAENTRQPKGYWSFWPDDFTRRCSWVILQNKVKRLVHENTIKVLILAFKHATDDKCEKVEWKLIQR